MIEALNELDDVSLTLFTRNKNQLTKNIQENCTIVEGDAMNFNDVKDAVTGKDIVYINLAGNLEAMAKNIVKAMQEAGVKKVITISSIGIYKTPLSSSLVPYRKLADVVVKSYLFRKSIKPLNVWSGVMLNIGL